MTQPRKVSTREELQNLKRSDLQKLAKDHNIKANLKTDALIEELIQIGTKVSGPKSLPQRRGKGAANHEEQENEPLPKSNTTIVRTGSGTSAPATRTRKAKDQVELGVGKPKVTSVTTVRKPLPPTTTISTTIKSPPIPASVVAANPGKATSSSIAKTKPRTGIPKRTGNRVPTSTIAKAARAKPTMAPIREGEQSRPSIPAKSMELVASSSGSQLTSPPNVNDPKQAVASLQSETSLVRRGSSPTPSDMLKRMSHMQEELTEVRLELDTLRQEVLELRKDNSDLRARIDVEESAPMGSLLQRLAALEKLIVHSKGRTWSASSSDGEVGIPPISVARPHLQATIDPYTPPAQTGSSVPPRSRTPQALAPAVDILPGSGGRDRWSSRAPSNVVPTATAFARSASQTSVQADDAEQPASNRTKTNATYIPPGLKSVKKRVRESLDSPAIGPSSQSQPIEMQQDAHKAKRRKLESGASHPPTAEEAEHQIQASQESVVADMPPRFFRAIAPQMTTPPPSMPRFHPALEAPGSPSPTRGPHGRVSHLLPGLPLPPPRHASTPFERDEIHKDSLPIAALPFPLIPSPVRAPVAPVVGGSARKRPSSSTREGIAGFAPRQGSSGSGSGMSRREQGILAGHPYQRPDSRHGSAEPVQSISLAPAAPLSSSGSTASTVGALKSPLLPASSLPDVPEDEILDLSRLEADYSLGAFRAGAFLRQDPSSATIAGSAAGAGAARVGDSPEFFITPGMRRGGGINGAVEETPPASKTLFGTEIGTVMRTKFSDPL